MCTLVLVLWGQSFQLGFYKACYYDCGFKKYRYMIEYTVCHLNMCVR